MRENTAVTSLRMTSVPVLLTLLLLLLLAMYSLNSGLLASPVQADMGAIDVVQAEHAPDAALSAAQPLLGLHYSTMESRNP